MTCINELMIHRQVMIFSLTTICSQFQVRLFVVLDLILLALTFMKFVLKLSFIAQSISNWYFDLQESLFSL